MPDHPIEPESIEYIEPEPPLAPIGPHGYAYEKEGCPCCSGCGCLALGLAFFVLFDLGSALSAVLILILAAWLSGILLRLAGVGRFSPAYAYLIIPVFFASTRFLGMLIHGYAPFSWGHAAAGTMLIWAFLWLIGSRASRR